MGWWPDGSAIVVRHEFEGTFELYRVDPDSGQTTLIAAPSGEITEAAVRPDGQVWFQTSDSVQPPRVVNADGEVVLRPAGPPPSGTAYRSIWLHNPAASECRRSWSPRRATGRIRR